MIGGMKTACAYYRTSSIANVGPDKDSLKRQQDAARSCAASHGLEIVQEYYDAAVSGADPVDSRSGFCAMLAYMLGNGARTVIVENASRFARDLMVQETGYQMLKSKGIELIAADAPDSFLNDTPTAVFVRQVLGAASQMEKAMLVNKLRAARDRKRAATGRCEGNPAWLPVPADVRSVAHDLRGSGLSLLAISRALDAHGMLAPSGRAYSASSVKAMLKKPL
jgi:DNA invertase Pin-like site-specific DNA recombinase